eukprot:6491378-Amphidinium_carterae.2
MKHQFRICSNNAYLPEHEPKTEGAQGFISFQSFLKLIEVAFPPQTNVVEARAMLKRATWVVFGDRVYLRPADAGEKTVERPVQCFEYPGGKRDLLKASCKERLSAYKNGQDWDPIPVNEEWSKNFIKANISKKRQSTVIEPVNFGMTPTLHEAMRPPATTAMPSASSAGPATGNDNNPTTYNGRKEGHHNTNLNDSTEQKRSDEVPPTQKATSKEPRTFKRAFSGLSQSATTIDISDSPVKKSKPEDETAQRPAMKKEEDEKSIDLEEELENLLENDPEVIAELQVPRGGPT